MSMTLMEHPEHGLRKVPLNEWARYRKSGWAFCNDKAKSVAQAEQEEAIETADPGAATSDEPAQEAAKATPARRTTKPKAEE